MIADLIDDNLNIRLITRNIMSVYSTDSEYTDRFLRKLKHSEYVINNDERVSSDNVISYIRKTYNIYENIFRFVHRHKEYSYNKFIEYLHFLNLDHLLWLHFNQLSKDSLCLVEILLQLSTSKPIVIIDYIDDLSCKKKLYTLLFHVGLEDRLIIIPFRKIDEAINNSTCQCYVKSQSSAEIQSRFSEEYLVSEFGDSFHYNGLRPIIYTPNNNSQIVPTSYKYTFYECMMIVLFSIKLMFIQFNNWRMQCQ